MQNDPELSGKYLGTITQDFVLVCNTIKEAAYQMRKREISDYPQGGKDTYLTNLNTISSMNLLSGVSTGISMLPMVVGKLKSNEQFRLIA